MALGRQVRIGKRAKDEGEKPFWISYADLMTALMVLFLVVMSVALLAVTRTISEQEAKKEAYEKEVAALLDEVAASAEKFPQIKVDRSRMVIDFGDRVRYAYRSFELEASDAQLLRAFVPEILRIADGARGRRLLKRVVVEGFTDQQGSYLYNLNLSLQRSQSVLCALLAAPEAGETPLDSTQRMGIRDLFLVGGYSFNSARTTPEASRRVEFRLELYGVEEEGRRPSTVSAPIGDFGTCALT